MSEAVECTCAHCGQRFQAAPMPQHRVMCGDSTVPSAVERLMAGEQAGLLATDPPYGVAYDAEGRGDSGRRDCGDARLRGQGPDCLVEGDYLRKDCRQVSYGRRCSRYARCLTPLVACMECFPSSHACHYLGSSKYFSPVTSVYCPAPVGAGRPVKASRSATRLSCHTRLQMSGSYASIEGFLGGRCSCHI